MGSRLMHNTLFPLQPGDMTGPLHQPAIVVPVHPGQRSQIYFLPGFPTFSMYHLRLVLAVGAFCYRIVVIATDLLPVEASNSASCSR